MKLLNVNIIQIKYGISIYQTDHIIKNIIQEFWGTKKKEFQKSPFPIYTSFEQILLVSTPLIGAELKQI